MTWIIETGVPIPPPCVGTHGGNKRSNLNLALAGLAIGDSLFTTTINRETVVARCLNVRRHHGHQYAIRAMDGGIRVWRVG